MQTVAVSLILLLLVIGVGLVLSGPATCCSSVWLHGAVANEKGQANAFDAITKAEGSARTQASLVPARQLNGEPRTVREHCVVDLGVRKVGYDESFFHVPGGEACGPDLRAATPHRG